MASLFCFRRHFSTQARTFLTQVQRSRFSLKKLANPLPKALHTARRGVPAQLAARLRALLRKHGGQDLVPFRHPDRASERKKGRAFGFQASALSETAGARALERSSSRLNRMRPA